MALLFPPWFTEVTQTETLKQVQSAKFSLKADDHQDLNSEDNKRVPLLNDQLGFCGSDLFSSIFWVDYVWLCHWELFMAPTKQKRGSCDCLLSLKHLRCPYCGSGQGSIAQPRKRNTETCTFLLYVPCRCSSSPQERLDLFIPFVFFYFMAHIHQVHCGQLYDTLKNLKITTRPSVHENNNEHGHSESAHLGLAGPPWRQTVGHWWALGS